MKNRFDIFRNNKGKILKNCEVKIEKFYTKITKQHDCGLEYFTIENDIPFKLNLLKFERLVQREEQLFLDLLK